MYILSDYIIFPLLYYIVRYRRKMVSKNIALSFPELTEAEQQRIIKGFYHHLSDVFVEMVYGLFASEKQMRERVAFHGVEQVIRDVNEKGGVIFMLGHVGNWEWIAEIQREIAPYGMTECNVYRKQRNRWIDRLMLKIRNRRGGICVDKNFLLRAMVQHRKEGLKVTYGLICDQKPSPRNSHYWTSFLHQDTSFLDGGELLSKRFDYPVYYGRIISPRRGHYEAYIDLITRDPKNTPEWFITQTFADKLEQNIKEQPEMWLWTHNRWKWKREDK